MDLRVRADVDLTDRPGCGGAHRDGSRRDPVDDDDAVPDIRISEVADAARTQDDCPPTRPALRRGA